MTLSPGTHVRPRAEAAEHGGRLLPPARYRHPGDVIRLFAAGLVLAGGLAVAVATHAIYAGAGAAAVTALAPAALAGRVLAGVVLAVLVTAAAAAVAVTLRYRRFRLLAGLAGAAVVASAVVIGFIHLTGGQRPRDLAAGAGQWPWLTGGSLAGPALLAAAVAVTVAAAPWLSRPWRRAAWIVLWLAAVVRLVTGTASPAEAVVAFAAGVTAGAAVLVLFGVPDRRLGPQEIVAALGSAGLPVTSVEPAGVEAKGSRPFVAAAEDEKPLFIKVLGSDQRDADLLYRAYRFIRLREVGDTRPAASLIQAVEHQALAAVMAERAGVAVPAVRQVIKTADGSALLAMDRVDGSSLDQIPAQRLSDTMLRKLWEQVDRLHRARIAHRSLRAANIVADGTGRPWVVDFSFSELGATPRQMALDVAELLASLAAITGADRAVATATAVIGPDGVAAAVPLLQPLALSARTRRGRVLLPAPAVGTGRRQLASHPDGRLGMAAPSHRLVGHDLPSQRGGAHRRGAAADPILADRAGPGCIIIREPGLPGQRRRHGVECPVPAEIRGGDQCRRRRGRSQQRGGRRGAPSLAGGLLRLVRPRARARFQAAVEQQAAADSRHRPGDRRHRAGDPSGPPAGRGQAGPWPEVGGCQPAAGGAEPGQDAHAVRRVGSDHAGLCWRARRLRPGVWRGAGRHPHRRCIHGCRSDRGRRPQPRRPGRDRGGPDRGPDRCRHGGRTRRFRRAAVPAGHLLAARGAGLVVLARPAAAGLRMKPRAALTAACTGLAVTLSACTPSSGSVPSAAGLVGRPGTVITVGSFDFPESVLLAEI